MKTFLQWCEENQLDPNVVTDAPEPKKATAENTKRTGLSANYPDAYVRGQYPKDHYFNPIKATAELDKVNKPASYSGPRAAN
jgi:hypothetical protein